MNASVDDAPLARPRETPGAAPQTPAPLQLLQTPRRPVAARPAPPRHQPDWLARMSGWLRAGR